MRKESICFIKREKSGIGGPETFLENFKQSLKEKKIFFFDHKQNFKPKKIFLISATFKYFFWLIYQKFKGNEIIQRVDGKLWLYKKNKVGSLNYIYSVAYNLMVSFTMSFISNKIIFQSKYVKNLWSNYFIKKKKQFVIYNFCKKTKKRKINKNAKIKIICVEGNLDSVFNFKEHIKLIKNYPVFIYGEAKKSTQNYLKNYKNIKFMGKVSRDKILKIYNSNEKIIFFSLEFNAACSNSVIEAMSHSTPLLVFKNGCMKELVNSKNGILINYDINKFREKNYLKSLNIEKKIQKIEKKYLSFSKNSYALAIQRFNKNYNSLKYINSIFN